MFGKCGNRTRGILATSDPCQTLDHNICSQTRMMTNNHSFNYKLRTMCHKCPRMCRTLQRGIFDFDLLSVQRSRPRSHRISPAGRFPWRERDVGLRPVSEPRRRLHRGGRHAGPGGGAQLVEGDQPGEDWGSTEKLVSSQCFWSYRHCTKCIIWHGTLKVTNIKFDFDFCVYMSKTNRRICQIS